MNRQGSAPPSDAARQDKQRETVIMIFAIGSFVLLLGVNVLLIGGLLWVGAWCNPGNPDVTRCSATMTGLALFPLPFMGSSAFLMFRRRYRLALTVMAFPPLAWAFIDLGNQAGWWWFPHF